MNRRAPCRAIIAPLLAREGGAVPIAVRITPSKLTREEYEKIMQQLEETGGGPPEGRVFHAGYGEDEVHIFDVWDSHESFEPYHRDLMAVLQGAGVDAGTIQIEPVHNTIDR
jgi:hypothetical protein